MHVSLLCFHCRPPYLTVKNQRVRTGLYLKGGGVYPQDRNVYTLCVQVAGSFAVVEEPNQLLPQRCVDSPHVEKQHRVDQGEP